MTQIKRLILITLCLTCTAPFKAQSQNTAVTQYSKGQLLSAAREITDASGTCALITLDEQSIPMVRIMEPFPPESDFTVWFGTNAESRKVKQIKNNPNVTLFYQDSDNTGYVVIHGKAQIIDDERQKEKWWKAGWEAFYPNNRAGFLLIKVSPDWMEVLSVSRGIIGDSITWRTPVVRFR